ncbi:MAG: aminoacetone oxidase family FAD-binding enzyme [Frisingicoccus sp.]
MKADIIVIGGGASGLAAAICAARQGASVLILERMARIGKKLLATGNGKCNFTNRSMEVHCYHSRKPSVVRQVLEYFDEKMTEDFFMGLGILPKERDGYVYPNSMQSASVLDALRFELEHLGVGLRTEDEIYSIRPKKRGFLLQGKKEVYHCRRVILACGGKASDKLGSNGSGYILAKNLGHRIIPVVPALTGLKAKEKSYKALAGVRVEAEVTLLIDGKVSDRHRGEVQLADYGISGIPVFQLSGQAAYGLLNGRSVVCMLDFFPELPEDTLRQLLVKRQKQFRGRPAEVFETGLLNRKLIHECLRLAGGRGELLPEMSALAGVLKHFPATITESRGYAQAQVCAGGVDLKEIHPKSCESILHPGLYIVGELLDADGICGGYNLQWAWATGYLAGTAAGKECHASNRTN